MAKQMEANEPNITRYKSLLDRRSEEKKKTRRENKNTENLHTSHQLNIHFKVLRDITTSDLIVSTELIQMYYSFEQQRKIKQPNHFISLNCTHSFYLYTVTQSSIESFMNGF